MANDELERHLDKGRYGSPLLKPDEQRKYLGTFRERCYVSMTVKEMGNKEDQQNFANEVDKFPDASLLINGAAPEALQTIYVQLATKTQRKFTVVNDAVSADPDSIGVLLVAAQAVDEPVIDIEEKYPQQAEDTSKKEEGKPKENFWERLFH